MKTSFRKILTGLTLGSLCALSATAQDQRQPRPEQPRQRPQAERPRAERPNWAERPSREEMLRRFDADGDGVLSEEERATARETLRKERQARQQEPQQEPRGGARPERPERPERPSREEMLRRFDADSDGVLSEEERATARETLRKEHQARQQETRGDARPERPERPDRPERPERPDRPERPEQPERPTRPARPER